MTSGATPVLAPCHVEINRPLLLHGEEPALEQVEPLVPKRFKRVGDNALHLTGSCLQRGQGEDG